MVIQYIIINTCNKQINSYTPFLASFSHVYNMVNCILVPIPKGRKDPSYSDNYRPIALVPTISKLFELSGLCLHNTFSSHFSTSELQFGFKPGFSTTLYWSPQECCVTLHICSVLLYYTHFRRLPCL